MSVNNSKFFQAAQAAEQIRLFLDVMRQAPQVVNAMVEAESRTAETEKAHAALTTSVESLRVAEAEARATVTALQSERVALKEEHTLIESIKAKRAEVVDLEAAVSRLSTETENLTKQRDEARADLEAIQARLAGATGKR